MNSSSGSYLPSILIPARCNGATDSVSAFLKCLTSRGLSGVGFSGLANQHTTVKRVAEIQELSVHLRNDIGMSHGQYMTAQLASALEESDT